MPTTKEIAQLTSSAYNPLGPVKTAKEFGNLVLYNEDTSKAAYSAGVRQAISDGIIFPATAKNDFETFAKSSATGCSWVYPSTLESIAGTAQSVKTAWGPGDKVLVAQYIHCEGHNGWIGDYVTMIHPKKSGWQVLNSGGGLGWKDIKSLVLSWEREHQTK